MNQDDQSSQPATTDAPKDSSDNPAEVQAGVCTTCGGSTEGYKCTKCGETTPVEDPNHVCGVGLCQPHCQACDQPESKCLCTPKVSDVPVTPPGRAY